MHQTQKVPSCFCGSRFYQNRFFICQFDFYENVMLKITYSEGVVPDVIRLCISPVGDTVEGVNGRSVGVYQ